MIVWDYAAASHLLRRAGFGAPRKDVEKAVRQGQAKTVAKLLAFKPSSAYYQGDSDFTANATWWLLRMLSGNAPLQEKLALFWHGHFATSYSKVEDVKLLSKQNRLFRRYAKGSFRDLCQAVAQDPAMIYWLDNYLNTKDAPNENFAREVMELFTVGIVDPDGVANYTQMDVVEAARAFTGWTIQDRDFYFDADQHDFGSKTFRGHTGNFDGDEIVELLVTDRQTGRYLAKKLWEFFAYRAPDRAIVEALADVYVANDTLIEPVVQAIFLHDEFYSDKARTQHVSSPVEYAVGMLRTMRTKVKRPNALPYYIAAMGQELFNPPNVAGWPGHLAWMSSVTRLNRMDFSWNVVAQRGDPRVQFKTDPVALLDGLGSRKTPPTADAIVARVVETFGIAASPQARMDMAAYLTTEEDPENPGNFIPLSVDLKDRDYVDAKLRGLVGTVLTLPEAYLS